MEHLPDKSSLAPFLIGEDDRLVDALERIDENTKGFVVVVKEDGRVAGTLTDGDVRRALLRGTSIQTTVAQSDAHKKSFTSLTITQGIDDAIDIFKQGVIDFLPVVDEDGKLVNILLKKQLYSLLLECRNVDLTFDFSSIDDGLIDFEVFNRPWGLYKTTILQENFQAKIIQVKPKGMLSLQYHNHREEYWTVASGTGIAQVGESRFILNSGSNVVIPRGCVHRLINTSETDYLVVSEVQVGDYFGEDDIVRIEDIYGRVKETDDE